MAILKLRMLFLKYWEISQQVGDIGFVRFFDSINQYSQPRNQWKTINLIWNTHMKRSYYSTSSSMEPTDDRSWDVKTFQAGVVAVGFAVVLNCLVSLSFRIILSELLFHHCRLVAHYRYLNYLHQKRHCQRAMVVMNLEKGRRSKIWVSKAIEKQSKYLVGF